MMQNTSVQSVRRARENRTRTSSRNGNIPMIPGLGNSGTPVPERHQGVSSHDELILSVRAPHLNRFSGRRRGVDVGTPVHSVVDHEAMSEERDRGGCPAPRDSLNIISVITLDETTDAFTENESIVEVMQELATFDDDTNYDAATSSEDDDNHGVNFSEGVPPVNFSHRIFFETNRQMNEDDAIANDTIDLTDSPLRQSQILNNISSPRQEQTESPPSLKCPVCMEDFLVIRRRGSRLVSTICGHVFCGKCLPACVRTRGQCPTCRTSIGYDDFHPVYLF